MAERHSGSGRSDKLRKALRANLQRRKQALKAAAGETADTSRRRQDRLAPQADRSPGAVDPGKTGRDGGD